MWLLFDMPVGPVVKQEVVVADSGDVEVVVGLVAEGDDGMVGGLGDTPVVVFGLCLVNIAKLRTIVTTFPMILPWLPLQHLH